MFRQFRTLNRILQPVFSPSTNISTENSQLMERLSSEYGNATLIQSALKNNELNSVHFDEWKNRIDLLKRYHFSDSYCFQMIIQCPSLLIISKEKFEESLQQWFFSDLGIHNFHYLLSKEPQLIEIQKEVICKRLPFLRSLFRSSTGLTEMLVKSPNVMFDDWNSVLTKIDYLTKERGFKMGEIMQSSALSDSLHFIKFRLDLLEKSGIYKQDFTPIHKQNEYDITKHKNPHLKAILVTSPKAFIKTAKISLEEYFVCSDLFDENEEVEEDDDDVDLAESYKKK